MRARRAWRGATAAGLLLWLALPAPVAEAHALLVRGEPASGVALSAAPSAVHLWFSESVQVASRGVEVVDGESRRVDKLDATVAADDPHEVDVGLADLAPGAYVVRWRVTSADNHVVSGTTWFAVGFAAQPPPLSALVGSPVTPPPRLEVAGRWLVYAAALLLVGAGAVLTRRAAVGLLAVLAAGQLMWLLAQLQAAEEDVWTSRFALLWLLRLLSGVALAAWPSVRAAHWALPAERIPPSVVPGGPAPGPQRPAAWSGGLLWRARLLVSALLLASLSLGSHATGGGLPVVLGVLLDVTHLAAASIWLGALLQALLLLAARVPLSQVVPRTSRLALGSMVVLVATGLVSAWSDVQTRAALVATAYGQTLLVKLGLVTMVLIVAAVNLLVVRPRVSGASRRLTTSFARLVLGEVALAVGVLGATGLMTSLPPPGQQALPEPFSAERQAGSLRVTFSADPNWVGVSHFAIRLADRSGRDPSDVTAVTLTFTMRGMNMGRTTVVATPSTNQAYEAGGFVGMPGISEVGVGIQRSDGPDESAVFEMDVPDVSEAQFNGLAPLLAGPAAARTPADPARGQQVYAERCQVCHGASGVGDGPAAASLVPPPSDLTLHARWHGDPQLFWFVSNGVARTAMPSFNDLPEDDRWQAISYLHILASAAPSAVTTAAAAPEPAPTPAAASPARLSGKLVYGPDTDHDFWVLELPEGRPQRITAFGRLDFPSSPAWSPDGQRIAYAFYTLPDGGGLPLPQGTDVYVMQADGSGQRPVSVHDVPGATLQSPAWAPDGSALYVAYQAQKPSGELDVGIDRLGLADGSRTRVVPNAVAHSLSPDGRWLAYVRLPTPSARSFTLWRSRADGGEPLELIGPNTFTRYSSPRFSPDGQHLVFAAVGQGPPRSFIEQLVPVVHADGDLWDLWTIDTDGGNLRRVTAINEDLPVTAWSADGRHLAFLGGGSATTAEAGVTIVDSRGGELTRLTTQPGHRGLDWTR